MKLPRNKVGIVMYTTGFIPTSLTTTTYIPCNHEVCKQHSRPAIKNQLLEHFKTSNNIKQKGCGGCNPDMSERKKHLESLNNVELHILYESELGKEPFYVCLQ